MCPLGIAVFLCMAWLSYPSNGQLAWTPIYVDGKSQIDLWTKEAKGCPCPWDASNRQCACCVADGGCHCGKDAPNRCTQCGLEQHCNHMCNLTLSAADLQTKSGKHFGQIKSPSLQGPSMCWYTFLPSQNQRVEIQVYRLVNTGKFNGTSCVGGHLQLMSGTEPLYSHHENQLCGTNERYSPPVVFFSDNGVATLLFEITEETSRSQFLAYFSFSDVNATDGVGFQPRGGMPLQNTDCDWLYQDSCEKQGQCVLASPGYPGIYPPNRQCRYHIRTGSSERTHVKITFTSLLLPPERCNTSDYVAIYKAVAIPENLLGTLCGNQRKMFEFAGSNLLIEFRTGTQHPPFEYNGFVATLDFYKKTTTPLPTTLPTVVHRVSTNLITHEVTTAAPNFTGCDILISGNNTRSGQFDTREYDWYPICRITFRGRPSDVVHISFFNLRLRSPSCRTVVEVFDGALEIRKNMLERLCSPQVKQSRDPDDLHSKRLLSSRNEMVIFFQRPNAPLGTNEAEFLAGRYFFHDEQISGTVLPAGMCDVIYKGSTSPSAGMIDNPSTQHLYWNMEGPLLCTQKFVPAANQSITLKVISLEQMVKEPACVTQCGDHGCRCVSSSPISKIDHVLIVNDDTWKVACLCGSYQHEWLPVSVRSWASLTLVYSVAHYTWKKKGFDISASYTFNMDTVCGEQVYTLHTGEIVLNNLTPTENLNHFYEQSCTWTLHSNVERQLELDISSSQNRPCAAWNVSIHEYSASSSYKHLGEVLHTFCSRDAHKVYLLPWKVSTVIVRLRTLSRTLPQFKVKWRSHVVRANTRFGGAPTPAPNADSTSSAGTLAASLIIIMMLLCFR
ncbi:PREDICTED: uncharacterized protein LOC108569152 [Nicrophorus vespilloides]|uniref:Uncharacterized protein LOC108569152 n=1 Tax=Nicrophorus vespilloides TaxID=110193 RepID=A0ABM1NGY3_NICVS|nr:PREDICTED: uncharacterized protein LOC108569152 [Nicrophorus vespilloides]